MIQVWLEENKIYKLAFNLGVGVAYEENLKNMDTNSVSYTELEVNLKYDTINQ